MIQRRIVYCILFFLTIPIGLATRKKPLWFHPLIAEFGGDILWATLFFFLFRIIFLTKQLWIIAVYTYSFALAIELSQLYHAPWINEWRKTFAGKMILGSGFLWSDLRCYFVGVLIGWLLATFIEKSTSKKFKPFAK